MQVVAHTFRPADYVGGEPVLDFVNTVTARDRDPRDWWDGYERVLEWAGGAPRLDADLEPLKARAQADPAAAEAALARLKALRETLFETFSAAAAGRAPRPEAVEALQAVWREARAWRRLEAAPGGVWRAGWDLERCGLDGLRFVLAEQAVDLLLQAPAGRLRQCPGEHCAWLFLDRSKAGRRRWCDMATCGNAAKSRRHYARRRARPA